MKIAIVGTGYVGLVSGTCFAEMGSHVTCVDVDAQKIERLKNGEMPIYEPGLEELVRRNVSYGRLQFTTDLTEVLDDVEVVFSAVGTPPDEDGSADLKYVLAVARQFGQHINKYTILVTKSTVPVGTAKKVKSAIQEELDKRGVQVPFDVASNPEFLKEGAAIKDFMSPDRVVVGTESDQAREVMTRLYQPFLIQNFRVIFMDIPSAEMTKYAANAMLATRISFMNDIAVAPVSPRMSRRYFIQALTTAITWKSSRLLSVSTNARKPLSMTRLFALQDPLRERLLPCWDWPSNQIRMICVNRQPWLLSRNYWTMELSFVYSTPSQ